MGKVVRVIFFGRTVHLLDRLVVPVIGSPEIERDPACQMCQISCMVNKHAISRRLLTEALPFSKMSNDNLNLGEQIKYAARTQGIYMIAQVEVERNRGT